MKYLIGIVISMLLIVVSIILIVMALNSNCYSYPLDFNTIEFNVSVDTIANDAEMKESAFSNALRPRHNELQTGPPNFNKYDHEVSRRDNESKHGKGYGNAAPLNFKKGEMN